MVQTVIGPVPERPLAAGSQGYLLGGKGRNQDPTGAVRRPQSKVSSAGGRQGGKFCRRVKATERSLPGVTHQGPASPGSHGGQPSG